MEFLEKSRVRWNFNTVFGFKKNRYIIELITLESGINVGLRLLIFELFSRGYVLIKGAVFYLILDILLFIIIFLLLFSFGYVLKIQII